MFKRRVVSAGVLLVLLVLLYTQEVPSIRLAGNWSLPLSGQIIALDAGHGGADGGAVSKSGLIEKDLNLTIALALRDYLQQAGALVLMTREGDYDLAAPETRGNSRRKTEDLLQRAENVRNKSATMTISIHMNSIPSPRWSGAQTFYASGKPESKRLAALIQDELRTVLGNTQRIPKSADTIYLLKTLEMPTALVEVGFLSHPGEAALLADERYRLKVAAAIYRGVLAYSSGTTSKPVL